MLMIKALTPPPRIPIPHLRFIRHPKKPLVALEQEVHITLIRLSHQRLRARLFAPNGRGRLEEEGVNDVATEEGPFGGSGVNMLDEIGWEPAVVAGLACFDRVDDEVFEGRNGPGFGHEVEGDVVSDLPLRAAFVEPVEGWEGSAVEPVNEELECDGLVVLEIEYRMRLLRVAGFDFLAEEVAG